MEKTIICTYWKNNTCKFMYDPSKCNFAHGIEDINKINCKYGAKCYNSNCIFYHGNEYTISNLVYDIPIVDKRKNKNKNKKYINYIDDIPKSINFMNPLEKQEIIPLKTNIPYIDIKYGMQENPNIIKIINKEKGIDEIINILNTDFNKMLTVIDEFYIKKYNVMVYKKNKYISQIIKDNYKNISYLRTINNDKDIIINKIVLENDFLKNENKKLKKEIKDTTDNMVAEKIKRLVIHDQTKLKSLYDKYIILYKLFSKYNNYKLINLNEIKKYTKDKNIYKIKQRATKVYKFYEKFKNGTIEHLLPVSFVFKMVF